MGRFFWKSKSNRPKTLKVKVSAVEHGRLLALADAKAMSLEDLLHEAVVSYLAGGTPTQSRSAAGVLTQIAAAETQSLGSAGVLAAAETRTDEQAVAQTGATKENSDLLALDYDDVRAEPRQSRLFWGG